MGIWISVSFGWPTTIGEGWLFALLVRDEEEKTIEADLQMMADDDDDDNIRINRN